MVRKSTLLIVRILQRRNHVKVTNLHITLSRDAGNILLPILMDSDVLELLLRGHGPGARPQVRATSSLLYFVISLWHGTGRWSGRVLERGQ